MKKILIALLVTKLSIPVIAQEQRADKFADHNDYAAAARLYKKSADKHPNQKVNYKLGECYRKMNRYAEALASYDKVNAAGAFFDPQFYLNYGLILKNNNQYESAKASFRKYDSLVPSDPRGRMYLNSCDIVLEDHTWDLPIIIENVKGLNSEYSDFGAVPYKKGIVFTSTRRVPMNDRLFDGWTGGYFQDIFYAEKDSNTGVFGKATVLEENMIDLHFHDGPAFFSKNYDTIYISRVQYDLPRKLKKDMAVNRIKIYSAKMGEYKWKGMEPSSLNSDDYSVACPFISPDGSKIYFSSDMPGGYGGSDIYVCKHESGGWSKPVNLGSSVNTMGRELFPALDSAGNLYFSSDGYAGFGGLDICVSLNQHNIFQKAIPMKYPFNSTTDDFGINFVKSGKSGYFSTNREGGHGDDDICHFDLDRDLIDQSITTSIYTIGYRPKQDTNMVVKIIPPIQNLETPLPLDSNITLQTSRMDLKNHPFIQDSNLITKKTNPPFNPDTFSTIHFAFDKYAVEPSEYRTLDEVAAYMLANPSTLLELDGFADTRGTYRYNIVLSKKRAESSLNYLTSKGVGRKRIKTIGYGYSRAVNRCVVGIECTSEEYEVNRRVEFKIAQQGIVRAHKNARKGDS